MNKPDGAVKVHMYNFKDVLRPRGSMEKESLALYLKERLEAAYESWTDESHGDLPSKQQLIERLQTNLVGETAMAWHSFCSDHDIKL